MNRMAPTQLATFAAGCFWGVEHYFNKQFKDAIVKSAVGYTGGKPEIKEPSYQQVCTGSTEHAEAVQLEFDPSKTTYGDLVTYFFRMHDPTTPNRQGNDRGSQYRSAIFYHDDEQKRVAEEKKVELQSKFKHPIVSEIVPATQWYDAEAYHQKYLIQNPGGYCNHRMQW